MSLPADRPTLRIDSDRLRTLLDGINAFGLNGETGGYNRPGFSDADMAVRRWFAQVMAEDGLAVRVDGAGNIWGRFGPEDGQSDGPTIIVGSHLDTVPEGGAFDGALGVAAALECVRAIRDAGLKPDIAIEVLATAEEEGRFGGMLGSQAIAGLTTREWLEAAQDTEGVRLTEAMSKQRLDPYGALTARRDPASVLAFLELHIEQGPILEQEGIAVGIADSVSGVCNLAVRLTGRANHSGTTPMAMRADAFAGLALFANQIPDIIRDFGGPESRVTIGKVDLQPNFPHTIPGLADFSIILRDPEEATMVRLKERCIEAIAGAAAIHGLSHSVEMQSWIGPVTLDAGLVTLLHEEAAALEQPVRQMPSGAGHDAQTMQALCPSALIFVPSRAGISHAPQEWTEWADIEKGATLLLTALTRLSGAK